MKKILSYMSLAIAGLLLGACSEDFKDWASQKAYDAEEAITIPGFTASALGTIDLNGAEDAVKILSLSQSALPEGATIDHLRFEATGAGMGIGTETLNAISADGFFKKSDLQALAENFFGKRPVERQFAAHAYADVMINGQAAFVDAGEFILSLIPEAPQISDNYYLIGGPGDWSADAAMTMTFNHSSKDVFEDPVFTYTFDGGKDMWFAFGDKDAIDAVAAGDWTKLYGTTGASEDLTGSFDRRYNLDGDHSFHIDGSAKMYRVSINMADMTYEIKELNFNEYIYEAGVNNDWGAVGQPLYCANQDGIYAGFFYAQDADWSEGKGAFKFTGAFNSWDEGNYGTGTINDDGLSGTLIDDGGSGNVLATPGFYKAEVNLAEMTYKLTPITGIGLIGPAQAGGWDTDTDLTYNPETRAWEGTIELAADEFKFRANDGWDINWGGTIDNLTQDGPNLKIETAGKYFIQFFPICETKSFAVITASE